MKTKILKAVGYIFLIGSLSIAYKKISDFNSERITHLFEKPKINKFLEKYPELKGIKTKSEFDEFTADKSKLVKLSKFTDSDLGRIRDIRWTIWYKKLKD